MNIYIGNLSYDATEDDLRTAFEDYGSVDSVKIITDRYTGKSKGFGFVEMADDDAAKNAITELNDKEFMGRNIKVNEARPRAEGGGGGRDRGRGRDRGHF
jgi:RNA recognition motif-containing protein